MNFGRHTYTHIIPVQYPPHKCLPKKSCLHSLRILIMSWLFKDPVNSGLTQFDHAQSNSKTWPKGQKDQIAPNESFSRKTTNKIFMYLLPLSFCKILKKFLEPIQSYEDVPFSGPKWAICPEQFFLVQTIIITFIYLLALFIVQNLKKFLQRIQSYEDAQFLGPKWSICHKFFF